MKEKIYTIVALWEVEGSCCTDEVKATSASQAMKKFWSERSNPEGVSIVDIFEGSHVSRMPAKYKGMVARF